jgi:tRNA (adenine37-N6)-methyltransferase
MIQCLLDAVAVMRGDFQDKFGTPRQPGLVPSARGRVVLLPPYDQPAAVAGLEQYSHLWLLFWCHANRSEDVRLTVRPPRLGGNRRLGVFATRTPYRPNPIGLSLVRFRGVAVEGGEMYLKVEGADIVDGTPILDIKPYLPYADQVAGAQAPEAFSASPPVQYRIIFSPEAAVELQRHPDGERLRCLIEEVLALDPRPAYHADGTGRQYGMRLAGLEINWALAGDAIQVIGLKPADDHAATDSAR